MQPQKFILALYLLITCTGWSQDEPTSNDCDYIYEDSLFCSTYVNTWTNRFTNVFDTSAFYVNFDKDQISYLHDSLRDTTHVRIYFMIPTTEMQLPGAVLVPYRRSDCSVDLTGTVIVAHGAGYTGGMGPISDSIIAGIENWNTFSGTLLETNELAEVYAYNFSWNHIMSACHRADYNLTVAYGISELDAEGSGECIHMYLTEGTVLTDNRLFLDFSRPCPKLCGSLVEAE